MLSEDEEINKKMEKYIYEFVDTLPETTKFVFVNRYGIGVENQMTLKTVSEITTLSIVDIVDIEASTLKKFKAYLKKKIQKQLILIINTYVIAKKRCMIKLR